MIRKYFLSLFWLYFVLIQEEVVVESAYTYNIECPSSSLHTELLGTELENRMKLIDIRENDTVSIHCCQHPGEHKTKVWYFVDRDFTDVPQQLQIASHGKDSPFITLDMVLVIREAKSENSKAYYCQSPWGEENDSDEQRYYLIDVIKTEPPIINGTIPDFTKYQKQYIQPVNELFNKLMVDRSEPLLNELYDNYGIVLKAFVYWESWGFCDGCKRLKFRRGKCRIQPVVENVGKCQASGKQCEQLKMSRQTSCHSETIVQYAKIGVLLKGTPDFVLSAKCLSICTPGLGSDYARKKNFHIIKVRNSLTLKCPGIEPEKSMIWRQNGIRLYGGVGADAKVNVDSFSLLHIRDVTFEEAGNYTCILDGKKVQEHIVIVREDFYVKYASIFRHAVYILYVLLLCFILYLGVMVITCAKYNTFKRITKEDVLPRYESTAIEMEERELFHQHDDEADENDEEVK